MKKDVLWAYLSQFLQFGSALLILPLLLQKLSSAELGVWYVFMTISVLVTMLDMGFTPAFARSISYVMGGAKSLLKDGYETVGDRGPVDYSLVVSLIQASRRIFRWIAVGAFVLLALPGTAYITHISESQVDLTMVLLAWGVFVIATVINLYYKYFTPLLQGRGLYSEFYKASAIANIGFLIVSSILLYAGLEIFGVALGFMASALIGRWLSYRFFYDESFRRKLEQVPPSPFSTSEILRTLWYNAWRLGVGVIGAFLILRANTILASVYLGLATTAAYALTLQVFSVLQSVSTVLFNIQQPKLAEYRITNQLPDFRRTMELGAGLAMVVFSTGALLLILNGESLIRFVGGNTEILPFPLLVVVGIMLFLELVHTLAAGVIITGNHVPFVKASIISGAAIILSSWVGLHFFTLGVAWLILSQFLVQLAYNNWRWPLSVYNEFYKFPR